MKTSLQPTADVESRKRRTSAIVLTIFLAATFAAALAKNVLGGLALLAAPFWLPVCCYFVPLGMAVIYLGISLSCLLLYIPIALLGDSLQLPSGSVFMFGLGSLMMSIGSSLGVLVAYSKSKGKG